MVKKNKKNDTEVTYAIQWGRLKLTYRVVVTILSMLIFGSILIINVGYDKNKGGCYWKPADVKITIQRKGTPVE